MIKKVKVKVVKSFVDATTGKVRNLNEKFSCTEKRYQEIEKKGHFVEKTVEKQDESKE